MATHTHGIRVAGSASATPLVIPTLVVGFDMARRSRSRIVSTDAGSRVIPRPASLRQGRLEFLFTGAAAASDSSTLEISIAQGIVHYVSALIAGTPSVDGIFWALAESGEVRRTLNDDRKTWTVAVDAQEVDYS